MKPQTHAETGVNSQPLGDGQTPAIDAASEALAAVRQAVVAAGMFVVDDKITAMMRDALCLPDNVLIVELLIDDTPANPDTAAKETAPKTASPSADTGASPGADTTPVEDPSFKAEHQQRLVQRGDRFTDTYIPDLQRYAHMHGMSFRCRGNHVELRRIPSNEVAYSGTIAELHSELLQPLTHADQIATLDRRLRAHGYRVRVDSPERITLMLHDGQEFAPYFSGSIAECECTAARHILNVGLASLGSGRTITQQEN